MYLYLSISLSLSLYIYIGQPLRRPRAAGLPCRRGRQVRRRQRRGLYIITIITY